jgi:hypothetical protein
VRDERVRRMPLLRGRGEEVVTFAIAELGHDELRKSDMPALRTKAQVGGKEK